MIPKKIHLIGASKEPPPQYASFVQQMRALHPAWEMIIWDDATALTVVDKYFPEWKPYYCAYKIPVQRADIFRIMIVYLQGGFYLDMDMYCLKSLDDLCNNSMVIGVEKILSIKECWELKHEHPLRIANYMFGSRPRHDFWLKVLTTAKNSGKVNVRRESDVLDTTGPGLLTKVYHENINRYNDITLLRNNDKACPKTCGPASCHFGDYAVHWHMGSWRWESNIQINN